jgi:hypothetical protein
LEVRIPARRSNGRILSVSSPARDRALGAPLWGGSDRQILSLPPFFYGGLRPAPQRELVAEKLSPTYRPLLPRPHRPPRANGSRPLPRGGDGILYRWSRTAAPVISAAGAALELPPGALRVSATSRWAFSSLSAAPPLAAKQPIAVPETGDLPNGSPPTRWQNSLTVVFAGVEPGKTVFQTRRVALENP